MLKLLSSGGPMRPEHRKLFTTLLLISAGTIASANAMAAGNPPLIVKEQGSFEAGGTVISNPGTFDPLNPTPVGQTFHGDHLYAFYQIPLNARKLPLVMLH